MKMPEINAADLRQNLNVKVRIRGWRWFKIRLWFGCPLIRLGAWIAGLPLEVEETE